MQSFSEADPNSDGDMIGLVARFRNEAVYGREVAPVRGVRAQLKLYDKNDQEIGTGFSAALWMGQADDAFDLIPNGSGGSVLVCWGDQTKADVSWKIRNEVGLIRDKDLSLDEYPKWVVVTIMDSNHQPLLEPVVLGITRIVGLLTVTTRR